jgi:hypothetical protein
MTYSILILTATELSASIVHQSPVLADPPVAYCRLGEAPESTITVDSLESAHNRVYKGASMWRVMKWNAPFMIEAWVQLIDGYQVNSRILGEAGIGAGDGYGLDIQLSEMKTPPNDDLFVTQDRLAVVVMHDAALAPAPVESRDEMEAVFETSALTSLVGLALILLGLVSRGWRSPLKYRGGNAGLSSACIFPAGAMKLQRRSERELNSFSARYATIEVRAAAPQSGGGLPVAFR